MSECTSLEAKIECLKQIYIESLPAKIKNLESIHTQLSSHSNITESIDSLRDVTHKISGSAGSYDFHQMSAVAHDLEYMCRELQCDDVGEYWAHDIATLTQHLQGLISLIAAEID